jgi:hypothetical protein
MFPRNSRTRKPLEFRRGLRPAIFGLLALLGLAAATALPLYGSLGAAEPQVMVILWFDTEDYLLPASDDAAKRVAGILTERGIRATFKVVGEKARTLERRGRKDVIEALKRHDIGYHSNFHSVHPAPAEYLAECGWADGVAEFVRREGGGAADVRRIFTVETLACYGQPGSSWGPQTIAGLVAIGVAPHGVPTYVDEGNNVGLNEEPFWYAGGLNVYHMGSNYTRMELHAEGGLEEGLEKFRKVHARLREKGGGLISIFYHPAEWVHVKFWDGVNFARGANPPREEWKPPPQRPPAETEAAYLRFAGYVDFQRSLPGVKFITASELPVIYADPIRTEPLERAEAAEIARRIAGSEKLDFIALRDERFLSPADQLTLLVESLGGAIEEGRIPPRVPVASILGPAELPPRTEVEEIPWPAFRDALLDVRGEIRARRQVPSRVFAGVSKIAPADFLAACARVAGEAAASESDGKLRFPEKVRIPRGIKLSTERFIAPDTPELFGGWIIHVEGFRAPRICEAARFQAWTLKPARRARPRS